MNQMHERLICWTLNGVNQACVSCSEGDTEELFRGILFSRGIISSPCEEIIFEQEKDILHIRLKKTAKDCETPATVKNNSFFRIGQAEIEKMEQIMSRKPDFGNHKAAVLWGDKLIERQDIGRHNAIDKAVAAAAINGFNPAQCILGTSGRVSMEILGKAARAGFPMVFTVKFPSDLAAEAAEELGIMIVSSFKGAVERSGANRWAE